MNDTFKSAMRTEWRHWKRVEEVMKWIVNKDFGGWEKVWRFFILIEKI